MFRPTRVLDIELSDPPADVAGLAGYQAIQGLVRLHGTPLGYVVVPVWGDRCSAQAIRETVLEDLSWQILRKLATDGLGRAQAQRLRLSDLVAAPPPPAFDGPLPLVTVAVCTRDRPKDLTLCLKAIERLDYPNLDRLVIDNAPSSNATERLVHDSFPGTRYVREPRPGLNWARNRAVLEARGEILAFTDDDVIVDAGWLSALAMVFVESPEVMAVTGLVVPYELETGAQYLFEAQGGFGRGFSRRWLRLHSRYRHRWGNLGTGQLGTGANMAYRRSVFGQIGLFDPALDVGTATNGGGDLEMFYRVLREGHTLAYEPGAMVRHRHRQEYSQLRRQITNNGMGLASFWVRTARAYPEDRRALLRMVLWWTQKWYLRRLVVSFLRPTGFPRDLILAELKGFFSGLGRYRKALGTVAQIEKTHGPFPRLTAEDTCAQPSAEKGRRGSIAVRIVDLAAPLASIRDLSDHGRARVFVTWDGVPLGRVDIDNDFQSISATRLRESIFDELGLKLLAAQGGGGRDADWTDVQAGLRRHYLPAGRGALPRESLPPNLPVSVVVATLDRPDDLRECLTCLRDQDTPRPVEIVVVDNNPSSGLTPQAVAKFPGVVLVSEPRQGLAYARNAGFVACTGEIAIATDDDVRMCPGWLEVLVAPFVRNDVMIVTGNVFPVELETSAQRHFEQYGGLGRGFEPLEADASWFQRFRRRAVPTWQLGATANAAFRVSIFDHPEIGLMDEALGPGMPSGVGEDTYLFYKVLKAGYTLVYKPAAYVWHKHRREQRALHRQIFNYSKGHVAYHLTTMLRDGDMRALPHLSLIHI